MTSAEFSWDDLRVFLAVHRRGSHGGAARLLGVDPSTIGRRVAALEAALGTRLFDRTPGGVELTAAGATLLSRATRVEEEALAAGRELGGADARVTGTVRLTASDGMLHADPRWTVRASTSTPQVLACVEGAGIAIVATFIARREPRLVPVLPSLQPPSRDVWLVVHQDLRKTARVTAVLDWLQVTAQQL